MRFSGRATAVDAIRTIRPAPPGPPPVGAYTLQGGGRACPPQRNRNGPAETKSGRRRDAGTMGSPASYQQEQGWRFPFEEGFMHVAMILAVLAALAPQERAQDEVIQLKGEGKLIVGKVTGITDTT